MIYTVGTLALLIGGADAFSAGSMGARSSVVSASSVRMQVAEAEVASPVALAKVSPTQQPFWRALDAARQSLQSAAASSSLLHISDCSLSCTRRLQAADEARGLAIDSISKAESGHMGLPLGCAEIGAVLFGQEMCACVHPPSNNTRLPARP